MEEIKESKTTVTSYRLKEDVKGKIKQQIDQLGLTQETYFDKVVSIMELENVKQNNIFAVDAQELQDLTKRINNIFIGLCDRGNSFLNTKDIEVTELKNKYKDMLSDKENSITLQKQELQQVYTDLNILQIENDNNRNELSNIRLEYNKQLEQLENNLNDKKLIVLEYKQKNDDLLSIVAEYKQYKIEVEEYKKLLADSQAKNIDLSNSIKENDFTINSLNKNIEDLKQYKEENKSIKELLAKQQVDNTDLSNSIKDKDFIISAANKEIESVKQENQRQLERLKKENELNIKLAVADAKEELNNKLNHDQLNHNKEIEEYQNKYKALLEQLETIRTTTKASSNKDK